MITAAYTVAALALMLLIALGIARGQREHGPECHGRVHRAIRALALAAVLSGVTGACGPTEISREAIEAAQERCQETTHCSSPWRD